MDMNIPTGLPPLPKGLRGALSIQSPAWRDVDKVHAIKTSIQQDIYAARSELQDSASPPPSSLTQLRKDMVSLRQLDLSLLCQLLRLYEKIQDWKLLVNDRNSPTCLHEEPLYENTADLQMTFAPTPELESRALAPIMTSSTRSLALHNPDFDDHMLGPILPISNSRHSLHRNSLDRSSVRRHASPGPSNHSRDGAKSLGVRSKSTIEHRSNYVHRKTYTRSYSMGYGDRPEPPQRSSIGKIPDLISYHSPNNYYANSQRHSYNGYNEHSGTSESDDSLYLEPVPCTHEHHTPWKQHGRHHSSLHQHASHQPFTKHSTNNSYLYESTC